jgi:hypothetical protein
MPNSHRIGDKIMKTLYTIIVTLILLITSFFAYISISKLTSHTPPISSHETSLITNKENSIAYNYFNKEGIHYTGSAITISPDTRLKLGSDIISLSRQKEIVIQNYQVIEPSSYELSISGSITSFLEYLNSVFQKHPLLSISKLYISSESGTSYSVTLGFFSKFTDHDNMTENSIFSTPVSITFSKDLIPLFLTAKKESIEIKTQNYATAVTPPKVTTIPSISGVQKSQEAAPTESSQNSLLPCPWFKYIGKMVNGEKTFYLFLDSHTTRRYSLEVGEFDSDILLKKVFDTYFVVSIGSTDYRIERK